MDTAIYRGQARLSLSLSQVCTDQQRGVFGGETLSCDTHPAARWTRSDCYVDQETATFKLTPGAGAPQGIKALPCDVTVHTAASRGLAGQLSSVSIILEGEKKALHFTLEGGVC